MYIEIDDSIKIGKGNFYFIYDSTSNAEIFLKFLEPTRLLEPRGLPGEAQGI